MKAKNLSHRFVAVLTFFIGLGAVLLWSSLSTANKNREANLKSVGVLVPARVELVNLNDGSTRIETTDLLMVLTQPFNPSFTEPTELYPAELYPAAEERDLFGSNCGTLRISIDSHRNVSLNSEDMGTLNNFSEVT